MYKAVNKPVLLFETWPATKGDEENLSGLERKILRRIYGPEINNITQQYEIRSNMELRQLYKKPDIEAVIRYKRMARLVTYGDPII